MAPKILAAVLAAVPLTLGGPASIPYGETTHTIQVGGLARSYVLYVPKSYAGTAAVPLVLAFHGGGGTAENFAAQISLTALADRAGFIAVLPEGWRPDEQAPARFAGNPQTWNDGSGNYPSGKARIDDVGFVRALIAQVTTSFAIDRHRIYAEGFSNGGALVLRLGVELAGTMAAIAVDAPAGLYLRDPRPARPVPFVYVQGTADPINKYEGGHITALGIDEERPPVDTAVARLARMNGCAGAPAAAPYAPGVTKTTFAGCPTGMDVAYYVVSGMGHAWPGGRSALPSAVVGNGSDAMNATQVFWEFLSTHRLN